MSADLFAEFEGPSQPTAQPAPAFQQWDSTPTGQKASAPNPAASSGVKPPVYAPSQSQSSAQWATLQPPPPQNQPPQQTQDIWGSFAQPAPSATPVPSATQHEDDDDGWGEFEVADSKPPGPAAVGQAPANLRQLGPQDFHIGGQNHPSPTLPQETRTSNLLQQSMESPAKQVSKPITAPPQQALSRPDPNVLFDADDFDGKPGGFDDDDDFGDFEISKPEPRTGILSDDYLVNPRMSNSSLPQAFRDLSLKNNDVLEPRAPQPSPDQQRSAAPLFDLSSPTATKAPVLHEKKPSTSSTFGSTGAKKTMDKPEALIDDWGSFEEVPSASKQTNDTKSAGDGWDWDALDPDPEPRKLQKPAARAYQTVSTITDDQKDDASWDWDSFDAPKNAQSTSNAADPPPTNVPPPSILMSVFPQLLGQANEALYKPITGEPTSVKDRVLSDPKTVDYVRAYLILAIVAARIIAGRKLRWHRDRFLAQGMSISAAGAKGMKLAGVDKTQAVREDREAADILDIWRDQVGRLRSAVAAVNSFIQNPFDHLKIPELRNNIAIQTAKDVPTAPKACVVCGLKREERLLRVDSDVEDSFGEWWTEHWGHTGCKRFWLEHKDALRSR